MQSVRAELKSLFDVMRGENERGPCGVQLPDARLELGDTGGVELDEGLVEQRHRGLLEEETGERESLPHPGRVGADRAVVLRREAHALQGAGGGGDGHAEQARENLEILEAGEVLVDEVGVAEQPNLGPDLLWIAGGVDAEHVDLPRGGPD